MKATKKKTEPNATEKKTTSQEVNSNNENKNSDSSLEHVNKKQRILEKITYTDLQEDENHKSSSSLVLSKVYSATKQFFYLLEFSISFIGR